MHKIVSMNTIFPTKLIQNDYYAMPIIEDVKSLKPKPEKDVLLIIGDATNVLQDIEAWYKLAEGIVPYDTMTLNYSALVCPHPFQHYAAGDAHSPDMQRMAVSLPKEVLKHCWNPGCKGFDIRWIRNGRGGWNGTTSNLCFKIGLALDYTRIILCGCPMDMSGNWYKFLFPESLAKNDMKLTMVKEHRDHLWKWMEISQRPIAKFLRSMSGNTADLFGKPTREWLIHEPENPEKEETLCQMN